MGVQKPIKPCPNCGGKMKLIRGLPNLGRYKKGNSRIRFSLLQCTSCDYKTKTYYQQKKQSSRELDEYVINLWNASHPGN